MNAASSSRRCGPRRQVRTRPIFFGRHELRASSTPTCFLTPVSVIPEALRQLRDRGVAATEPHEDPAPRRIRQRRKGRIQPRLNILNHVAQYCSRARIESSPTPRGVQRDTPSSGQSTPSTKRPWKRSGSGRITHARVHTRPPQPETGRPARRRQRSIHTPQRVQRKVRRGQSEARAHRCADRELVQETRQREAGDQLLARARKRSPSGR